MKELIQHLLVSNHGRILERSLMNCHCIGLHSIMLLESPGQTIRLYIAEKGNHLYKNSPYFFRQGMSIGFHPHHCDLTLHCVTGRFWNWELHEFAGEGMHKGPVTLRKYVYQSQITDGVQGFKLLDEAAQMDKGGLLLVEKGESIFLSAGQMHTVVCDPFEISAWLVYEGREDPNYKPLCYSTSDLETVNTEGMYQKMNYRQLSALMKKTGLLA